MRYRWTVALLALALLTGTAGCDVLRQLDAAGVAEQEGRPFEQDVPPQPTLQPLDGLSENLNSLNSYRASLTLELRAAEDTPPLETVSILQEINRPQDLLHYRLAKEGNPTTAAVFEYFQLGPEFYLYTEQAGMETGCDRMTSQQSTLAETAQALTPEDVFGTIYPAELVARGEQVNGVTADHYTVDLRSMGLGSASGQQGDVWIAQPGGYVARFTGQVQGVILGFDTTMQRGFSSWSYDVEQANTLSSIQLSPACQQVYQLAAEFPLPEGASQPGSYGGVTTFTAPQPVGEVSAFYRTALAESGWNVTERIALERLVILDAIRQNTRLEITITQAEPGSSILIQER